MEMEDLLNMYKKNVLNIVLVFVSLILAFNIYNLQLRNVASLVGKKNEENKKNKILNEIKGFEKIILNLESVFGKKEASEVIKKLSKFASETSVRIVSIKPQKDLDTAYYKKSPIDITISADYHRISRFLSEIESSGDFYLVESLNIKSSSDYIEGNDSKSLTADVRISTLLSK